MTHKLKSILSLAALAFIAFCVCGCESIQKALDGVEGSEKESVDTALLATYFDGPKVRPGVALAISVTAVGASSRDSRQYFVDAEGCITMELVGRIKCEGMTLIELQQKVAEAYKEYYIEPSVTATFLSGQGMVSPWGTVLVLGEVARPGPVDVPSTMDLTVLRALQLAGGVTSIADKRNVKVTRCDKEGKRSTTIVDLVEIGSDGRPDKDMQLKAGDVVYVRMSWY
ncbi:MAG: polysaccharide biosynthesis/export family protein [Kiritimatiellae bacterium]|nr:polysaccharide biosynthesis/export family protein [Kiritimatiellia bacterium]